MSKSIIILFVIALFIRQIMIVNADNNTYINTTNIIFDEEKNIVELAEGSKINFNNTNILVDRGIIDYDNDNIEVFGNFYLYQDLNILSGKDLVGDTKLNNFKAYDVSYIYNDLKIDSDFAERSDGTVYFYNNFLTPELNGYLILTWSLRIDESNMTLIKINLTTILLFKLQIQKYFTCRIFLIMVLKTKTKRFFNTSSI